MNGLQLSQMLSIGDEILRSLEENDFDVTVGNGEGYLRVNVTSELFHQFEISEVFELIKNALEVEVLDITHSFEPIDADTILLSVVVWFIT